MLYDIWIVRDISVALIRVSRQYLPHICFIYVSCINCICCQINVFEFEFDSDNGLAPDLCQNIIRTSVDLLLIKSVGTNFREIWIKYHNFHLKKLNLKMSVKCQPFCLGNNMLTLACYIVVPGLTRFSLIHGDCQLFRTKPLPEAMMTHHQVYPWKQITLKFESKYNDFHSRKWM